MARIVKLEDQGPFVIKAEQLQGGACAVCRCGLSAGWPMCDGSHNETRDEQPGKVYGYLREGQRLSRRELDDLGDLEAIIDGDETVAPAQAGDVAASADFVPSHAGAQRPGRPKPEAHKREGTGTRGQQTVEEQTAQGDGSDELLAGEAARVGPGALVTGGGEAAIAGGPGEPKTAHGGKEGLAPKNRSGQGGEAA